MEEKIPGFDQFIAQYPIYDYRIISTGDFKAAPQVRTICEKECERYGATWACPPAVGSLEECEKTIRSYPAGIFFSSAAFVSDAQNMEETLSTRREHEILSSKVGAYLRSLGYETYILSTESCDICSRCSYLDKEPCRFPEHMHPCLESHGVVAFQIAQEEGMDYQLDPNTILWFSLILYRQKKKEKDL